jgi:hypothetical protein
LLNEPIVGHAVFWSSPAGKAYLISVLVMCFERIYSPLDRKYNKQSVETFAKKLRTRFEEATKAAQVTFSQSPEKTKPSRTELPEEGIDMMKLYAL